MYHGETAPAGGGAVTECLRSTYARLRTSNSVGPSGCTSGRTFTNPRKSVLPSSICVVRPSVRPLRPHVHPPARPSVCPSFRPSVRLSVRLSVRPFFSSLPSFIRSFSSSGVLRCYDRRIARLTFVFDACDLVEALSNSITDSLG